VRLGDYHSFFACKLLKSRGMLTAQSSSRVGDSTMRAACKALIRHSQQPQRRGVGGFSSWGDRSSDTRSREVA
jgi:hypothetical protein